MRLLPLPRASPGGTTTRRKLGAEAHSVVAPNRENVRKENNAQGASDLDPRPVWGAHRAREEKTGCYALSSEEANCALPRITKLASDRGKRQCRGGARRAPPPLPARRALPPATRCRPAPTP